MPGKAPKRSPARKRAKVLPPPSAPELGDRETDPEKDAAPPSPASEPAATTGAMPVTGLAPVVLRTQGGIECRMTGLHELFRLSSSWSSVVSNRQRFTSDSLKQLRDQSRAHLARMGVTDEFLKEAANRGVIEVEIPYVTETQGWERRIMPWESLLSLATKDFRGDRHLCVVRYLRPEEPPPAPSGPPQRGLLVSSAPGRLGESYSFDDELRLVASALQPDLPTTQIQQLTDPTEAQLARTVESFRPDLLHLTGIDAHQGATLLGLERDNRRRDGFYLAGEAFAPRCLEAWSMSELVTAGGRYRPRLVAYNTYFSGARLAAMAVGRGADASIGFQDSVDDTVAERFFTALYTHWRRNGWSDLLQAFFSARTELAEAARLLPSERQGGDVVLWTARSLLAGTTAPVQPLAPPHPQPSQIPVPVPVQSPTPIPTGGAPAPAPAPAPTAAGGPTAVPVPPAATAGGRATAPAATPAPGAGPTAAPGAVPSHPGSWIEIEIRPRQRLNYSLLHNDRSPFQSFLIRKFNAELQPVVEIDIQLHAGDTLIPFRAHRRLREMVTDLTSSDVRLPLVANFFHQLRESVHTTMAVEVRCEGYILHRDSYRVTLLPADEWTDDDLDRQWLPSFVLPRDPVIRRVIEAASAYLRAIADDSSRGFDGYQRVAPDGRDEEGAVDLQVRAIWAALLYESPLSYINPPPTYTPGAQRVRTPAQMFEGRHGTCLDLALLFAACLEYIGLMPVIFLIQGHAFPGYWRSEQAWSRWLRIGTGNDTEEVSQIDAPGAKHVSRLANRWVFGRESFAEIVPLLQDGGLVPVESTDLTRGGSFAGALETGFRNLATGWNFDALIDLQSARAANVTPLPLFDLALTNRDRTP